MKRENKRTDNADSRLVGKLDLDLKRVNNFILFAVSFPSSPSEDKKYIPSTPSSVSKGSSICFAVIEQIFFQSLSSPCNKLSREYALELQINTSL